MGDEGKGMTRASIDTSSSAMSSSCSSSLSSIDGSNLLQNPILMKQAESNAISTGKQTTTIHGKEHEEFPSNHAHDNNQTIQEHYKQQNISTEQMEQKFNVGEEDNTSGDDLSTSNHLDDHRDSFSNGKESSRIDRTDTQRSPTEIQFSLTSKTYGPEGKVKPFDSMHDEVYNIELYHDDNRESEEEQNEHHEDEDNGEEDKISDSDDCHNDQLLYNINTIPMYHNSPSISTTPC